MGLKGRAHSAELKWEVTRYSMLAFVGE